MNFKAYLAKRFCMKDLGNVKLFLVIRVMKEFDKISLNQSAYIKTVLEKFNMSDWGINTTAVSKINYE